MSEVLKKLKKVRTTPESVPYSGSAPIYIIYKPLKPHILWGLIVGINWLSAWLFTGADILHFLDHYTNIFWAKNVLLHQSRPQHYLTGYTSQVAFQTK